VSVKHLRRSWIARAVALGVIAGVVAFVIIDRPRRRTSPNAFRYARESQQVASTFPIVPLEDGPALEQAVTDLITAEHNRHTQTAFSLDSSRLITSWDGAVMVCVEYLRACSTGRANAYSTWATGQGKVLPQRLPDWGPYTRTFLGDRFKSVVGRTMPGNITPADYFAQYFESYWMRSGSELRPAFLASSIQAIEVKPAVFAHFGDVIGSDPRKDGLGSSFWIGGVTIGGMMFWWPERVLREQPAFLHGDGSVPRASILDVQRTLLEPLIRAHGSIDAVRVMLVYRSASDINVPTHFFLIRRPVDNQWELIGLHFSNVGADVGVGTRLLEPPIY
jgi:hypothetical protein